MFVFYKQLARPFKQGRKKLGIIFFLCAKALDGTNYDQRKLMNCARLITKNTTNLICHLENKHSGVASAKELLSKNNKKGLVSIGTATLYYIGPSPNTRVPSSISVTMNKFPVESYDA